MTSREFLETVRKLVCEADWQKLVRVGGEVNEEGDLMLRREEDGTVTFVADYNMICPLEDIQYILYKRRREDDDAFDDEWWGDLQLIFKMKGNNTFIYDIGENGLDGVLFMDGEKTSSHSKIAEIVAAHNRKMAWKRNLEYLIATMASIAKNGEEVSSNELETLHKEIDAYISEEPDNLQDFLLFYGYKALDIVSECGKDLFDVNAILKMLIGKSWETEFIDYVREQSSNPNDLSKNRTYVTLTIRLLQLLRENAVSSENASSKE